MSDGFSNVQFEGRGNRTKWKGLVRFAFTTSSISFVTEKDDQGSEYLAAKNKKGQYLGVFETALGRKGNRPYQVFRNPQSTPDAASPS